MLYSKPKLDYDEQITKLKELGILFNFKNEKEAKEILAKRNYFFKLAFFRKNFIKNKDVGYNCEFHALSELAIIDMRLRYILIQMCLDIEHSIKCLILDDIVNDPFEDGYTIMTEFFNTNDGDIERVFENYKYWDKIEEKRKIKSNFEKYYESPPVWVCLEIMTFGQLSAFTEFYYKKKEKKSFELIALSIKLIKNIRNKCAHSEPILTKLKASNNSAPLVIQEQLAHTYITNKQFHIKTFIDLSALFVCHKEYCSSGIVKARYNLLKELKSRYNLSIKFFEPSIVLTRVLKGLDKLVDNHNPNSLI